MLVCCKLKILEESSYPSSHLTVRIYVATTIEKVFLDSDDGLCIKKIRQIQWDETFLI